MVKSLQGGSGSAADGILQRPAVCAAAVLSRQERFRAAAAAAEAKSAAPSLEKAFVRPASTPVAVRTAQQIRRSLVHVVRRRRALRGREQRRAYAWEQFRSIRQDLTCLGSRAPRWLAALCYATHAQYCVLDGDIEGLEVCLARGREDDLKGLGLCEEQALLKAWRVVHTTLRGGAVDRERAASAVFAQRLSPCVHRLHAAAVLHAVVASSPQPLLRRKPPHRLTALLLQHLLPSSAWARQVYGDLLRVHRPSVPVRYVEKMLVGCVRGPEGLAEAFGAVSRDGNAEQLDCKASLAALDQRVREANTRKDFTEFQRDDIRT